MTRPRIDSPIASTALVAVLLLWSCQSGNPGRGAPLPPPSPAERSVQEVEPAPLVSDPAPPVQSRPQSPAHPAPTPREAVADDIPTAPMGRAVTISALAGMPGYAPPDDPELASVMRGRREAPILDLELAGGADSPEELTALILECIARSDAPAMQALRVSSMEYKTILWPEFPESRPVTHISGDDAWELLERRNLAGVTRAVDDFGGQVLSLDRLEYRTGRTLYTNFTLLQDITIVAHGEFEREVRLTFARSFVERHGKWKVFTYRD